MRKEESQEGSEQPKEAREFERTPQVRSAKASEPSITFDKVHAIEHVETFLHERLDL
jgi:hypothetical protein